MTLRAERRVASGSRHWSARNRGFTLIELMIVVVITSVLATLGVFAVRKYINSSKYSEAVQMLGSIKAAQEAFRTETFRYLDVSGSLDATHPMAIGQLGNTKWSWTPAAPTGISANFETLGVRPDGPVYFGYSCVAGASTQTPDDLHLATTPNWPTPGGPWYIAQAFGDLDGDGAPTVFFTSSFTSDIVTASEGGSGE